MAQDWGTLSKMTNGEEIAINRVILRKSGISIEGEFELPPLARLPYEDQVFIAMFIKAHGSIKDMEQAFGVSYPTIKGRLNRIGEQLGFVNVKPVNGREEIMRMLEKGEITAKEAIERLNA